MTEMQFSRLGLISTRPYYWMASPGGYAHTLGVIRLLDWGLQVPNARLGVSPRGLGLIIRSIQATVGLSLTAEEDALLRSVDAEDVVPWPQDVEHYGPVLDNLRLLLRGAEDLDGWIWLSAQDARWWVEISSEALREYEEELRASDPVLLDHLVSRHECLLFGSFDLDTFARQVQRPRHEGPLAQHPEYAQLLDAIAQSCHQLGVTATTKAYWSWQFLNFDRTRIGGDAILYNNPLLALWSAWPASSQWAPPRPADIEVAPPLAAEVAAEYLETVLWKQIETIFAYLTLDCGLPRGATIRSTGRETGAPVYYFATPVNPPSTPEQYRALQGASIRPLIRTCLYTDDPLSDRIAWGVVQGRAVTLRCEIAFEQFRPWILLLPLADDTLSEADQEINFEQAVAQITFSLTYIELTIDMKSADVEQEMIETGAEVDPWLSILERGNEITEQAIQLVPVVGQTDRADLARQIKYLQGPLRRLSARFEQTRSDLARVERSYGAAKDSTEDTLRRLTLRGLSAPGVRSLHSALLDAYPYHYLEEPLRNVRGRVETALSLTTQVTDSIGIVLAEAEQTAQEFQERWTRRLAVVISLLALLIGLPTFVPGATLRADTYPQGLDNIIPLSLAEGVLRALAATFAVGAALFLMIVLVSWIQRFQPTQEYDVERFALLLERVKGAVRDNLDESNLEALDIEGAQILGRIWRQVEQSTSSGPQTVQRWSWRLPHAMELSHDIRVFGDIVNLFLLLPDLIPLPRTLCILRFKFLPPTAGAQTLARLADFQENLRRAGFFDDDIARLDEWLSTNRYRIGQLDADGLATVLKARGVTTISSRRTPKQWSDYLDEEQLHVRQGERFFMEREYAKAVQEFRQAIRLNPRSADYYDKLGNAFDRLGQYDAACKAFNKAIGLKPQNPYFHNNLGETYVSQGNLAGAQREFLRRIQLRPDDAFAARTSLGVILIHDGKVEEGVRQLQAALRIYSQRAPRQDVMTADAYFMNRALALAGLGDPDSVAVWQEAVSRRQIPAEELADWKRYIDLLRTAPQPPEPIASIAKLLEVVGATRPVR